MKHISFLFTAIISCSLLLFSCKENMISGTGSIGSEQRDGGSFNAIEIAVPLKAVITINSQATVKLSGYKNILKYIKTEVKDNKLRIYVEPGISLDNAEYLNAEIGVPSLAALELEGAPDVDIRGSITGQDFKLSISGASDIKIEDVSTTNFSTSVSGAGDLKISKGNVQHAAYTVSGAGDIRAYGVHSVETTAEISGTGDIQVYAEQSLTASISGAGNLRYKGHPKVTSQTSGVGDVEDAN